MAVSVSVVSVVVSDGLWWSVVVSSVSGVQWWSVVSVGIDRVTI